MPAYVLLVFVRNQIFYWQDPEGSLQLPWMRF